MISQNGCWVLDDGWWWLAKDGCKVLCNRLTWCLCEDLCVLFFCVFLWEIERTHSMRWHTNNLLGSFFSHRTHRFNRTHLRTVSNSQNASGIQNSQNVKTIVDTNKGQHKADILLIGVSRWSLPFPPGEGSGEGPLSLWAFVCSVHLCYCVGNRTYPRYEKMSMRFAGEFFLSRRIFLSLTELTDLTEPFCALFRTHRTPPAYRYHRGLTPSPSPNGEGSSMWGYPYWSADDRRWAA